MPSAKQNKAYKFARAFHGPYRVKETMDSGVVVVPVDRPNQEPVRVAMDRVRRPHQIDDTFWPSKKSPRLMLTVNQLSLLHHSHSVVWSFTWQAKDVLTIGWGHVELNFWTILSFINLLVASCYVISYYVIITYKMY